MKMPAWLRLPPPLLLTAALVAWSVPGSAAVTAPRGQYTGGVEAPPTTCNPEASSLAPPPGPPVVTGPFMEKIRARGYLIAGVDQNTDPFGFLNPLDGQIEGFDIDMVKAVARAIFGDSNPDRVILRAISDAQREPDVRSGAVDIVAHTMTINCSRLKREDFSTVYFVAGQEVLVLKDSPARSLAALAGQKVCATTGSDSLAVIAGYGAIPVAVTYWTDCLVLLQQGDVAAISTDDAILKGLAAQDPWTKVVGQRLTSEPYGLAISKQHPDFVRFVNAVLEQMRTDGQWAASYAHWIGGKVPPPPPAQYAS